MQPWWGCRQKQLSLCQGHAIAYWTLRQCSRCAVSARNCILWASAVLLGINIDEFYHARGEFLAYDESPGLSHRF
jgi:hypothetical protein